MLAAAIPNTAFADNTYEIYNETYEDGTFNFVSDKAEIKVSDGGKEGSCLFMSRYENEEDAPRMKLKNLSRKSKAEISVSLKAQSGSADASLAAYITENGRTKQYIIAKGRITDSKWTELKGKMMPRLKNTSGTIELALICRNDSGYSGVYADNLVVTADRKPLAEYKPVEDIEKTGVYTVRTSFETGTLERLERVNAEFAITDEVPAHTGTKCLKISNRTESNGTLLVYLTGVDPDATVNVSCWARNMDGDSNRSYLWQGMIPTAEKRLWPNLGSWAKGTDDGWVKVEGKIKLSDYTLAGTPFFQIVATDDTGWFDFYVDDLIVTADKPGAFYDDMDYAPSSQSNPLISSSAYELPPTDEGIENDIPALKDVFKDYFKIGACVMNSKESDTTRYGQLLKKHFNSFVSNGYFHPGEILNTSDFNNYRFAPVDLLMDFAYRNGVTDVVGHALNWERAGSRKYARDANGNRLSRDAALKWLKEYITRVMTHCEGDGPADEYVKGLDYSQWHIDTWDVVNEAVLNSNGYDDESGKVNYVNTDTWMNILGEEYVDYTFKFADETGYDNVNLRYNDYNSQLLQKRKGVYHLVKNLKEKGLRVDKIGLQSHFMSDFVVMEEYEDALKMYSSLGVRLDVTELDIRALNAKEKKSGQNPFAKGITKEREYDQADIYAELFNLYREYKDNVDRVNFWTFYDGEAWWNEENYQKTEFSGIFDRAYKAKPLYWAIVDPDKYYASIDEDTDKPRIRINNVMLGGENRADAFNENGIIYSEAEELLKGLGASVKRIGNSIYFIRGDLYGEILAYEKILNTGFKQLDSNFETIERDGKIYVPVKKTAEAAGMYVKIKEHRNMAVILDSNQQPSY